MIECLFLQNTRGVLMRRCADGKTPLPQRCRAMAAGLAGMASEPMPSWDRPGINGTPDRSPDLDIGVRHP